MTHECVLYHAFTDCLVLLSSSDRLVLRKELWDRQGALWVLSQMDLGSVDMRKMKVFVWITVKYVMKHTDKLLAWWRCIVKFTLWNLHCEIYIVTFTLGNLHCVMVWKYYKVRYKSRGNDAEKPFKLCTGYSWLFLNLRYTNNIGIKPGCDRCPVWGWLKSQAAKVKLSVRTTRATQYGIEL